jgi:A/G-specific adenine glycosylase
VLIAEFMLIRTKASQVEPVYTRFIERYPTLEDAAQASYEDIQDILSPLGLSWRADRVYATIQTLYDRGEGVPSDRDQLLNLPGVSQYIAGAVRCFVFREPEPLIDTNTVRIAGRLFGLEVEPSSRRNGTFQRLISEMADPEEPRLYNFSMLDLGASVCTSRSPSCTDCPLLEMCTYGTDKLP